MTAPKARSDYESRIETETTKEFETPKELPRQRRQFPWGSLLTLALVSAGAAAAYYTAPQWLPYARARWEALVHTKPTTAPKRVVPVGAAEVRTSDVSIYLNGLGTVTAFYTVTVRTRIDGELVNVAFTEGQMVKEGDVLAEIDPRPYQVQLTQAEGQLQKDEASLKVAQLDLDRYLALLPTRSVTAQQVDAQRALVQQSEGAIMTDRGTIDNVRLQLNYCRITSPISGRIGLRLVDPGNMVHASDANGLAVVTQLQPIAVVFTIPQDDIRKVQAKMNADQELAVDAFDRQFDTKLATGKLFAIDNQVDALTGTLKLKAIFENKDRMLFPNQFVNARLLIETLPGVKVVPSAAVQLGPESSFVYVVKPDETVELRVVKPGATEGDTTVIEDGLQPGELVVTDGVDKLQPGTKVSVKSRNGEQNAPGGAKGSAQPKAS